MRNALDVQVSLFRGFKNPVPVRSVSLYDWLTVTDDNLLSYVESVRNCADKKSQKSLKESFWSITPSGTFYHQRNDSISEPSGFISIDIDNLPPDLAKQKLAVLPFISYIGESVSGNGVWALIPIKSVSNFSEHFYHIKNYMMESVGIKIDGSCGNLSRLRGYSFDKSAYFNLNAETYTGVYIVPTIERKSFSGGDNDDRRFSLLLDKLDDTGVDITSNRQDWVKIGIAIAGRYGTGGESYFHRISDKNAGYTQRECSAQYKSFLRSRSGVGMSTIFWLAKVCGVMLNN